MAKTNNTCCVNECKNLKKARGYCQPHYREKLRLNEFYRPTLKERFQEKYIPVTESGCWIWLAATNGRYGTIKVGRKMLYAHRLSYELYVGAIPGVLCVCHTCDEPLCINPDHLFIATHKQNMEDRDRKNRQLKGAEMSQSKINESLAMEIFNSPVSQQTIADKYGLSQTLVSKIKSKKLWKHIHTN